MTYFVSSSIKIYISIILDYSTYTEKLLIIYHKLYFIDRNTIRFHNLQNHNVTKLYTYCIKILFNKI